MHELGIMNDVLETALRVAEQNGGKKVTQISLKVGVMSGVMPQFMQSFFDVISKDTIARDAVLDIQSDPVVFRCRDCGRTTVYDRLGPEYVCRSCKSESLHLIAGRSFQILSVAII